MTAAEFYKRIMVPAALWCDQVSLPRSRESDVFLLAVAGQESGWRHRAQISAGMEAGPARGFWQFERGGGVAGVLRHQLSEHRALALCGTALVTPRPADVWRALEGHDGLAYGFARLLAWTDPAAISTDQDAAWAFYLRCWRPGKPHAATWPSRWAEAHRAVA
jgi:hypothetical protein